MLLLFGVFVNCLIELAQFSIFEYVLRTYTKFDMIILENFRMRSYKIPLIIVCVGAAIIGISFALSYLPIYDDEGLWNCDNILQPLVIAACILSSILSFLTLAFLIWLYITTKEQINQVQGDVKLSLFQLMDMVLRMIKPADFRVQVFPSLRETAKLQKKAKTLDWKKTA